MQEFSSARPGSVGTAKAATTPARTPILNTGTSTAAYSAIAAQRAQELSEKDRKEQGAIGIVQGLGMVGLFGSFMADLATAALSKVLTIGGLGGPAWKTKVDNVLRAPMRAMRNTEIGTFFTKGLKGGAAEFGANMNLKQAEFLSRSGQTEKAAAKLAKSEALRASAGEAKVATGKVAEVGGWLGRQIDRVTNWGPFRKVEDATIGKLAKWRSEVNFKKAEKAASEIGTTLEAPTSKPNVVAKHLFKKEEVAAPNYKGSAIEDAVEGIKKAGRGGLEEAANKANSTIRSHVAGVASVEQHAHLKGVRSAVKNVANHAQLGSAWASEGSIIGKALKSLPKAMGKASVFHVLAGAGIGLGIIARNMTTKHDNRIGDESLKDFAATVYGVEAKDVSKNMLVGKDAHPLVAEAAKINDKTKAGRNAYGAISGVAEVANVGTLKTGGMLLIPWYMFGDKMASTALLSENDTLKAYTQLRDAEMGKMQLSPEDKVGRVRFLISAVPAVARNHGVDNKMVTPIAEEMVQQGMSTKDILQTIASPQKMVSLAKVAQEKLIAKEAEAKAKGAEASPVHAANDNPKPQLKVSMAHASHEGTVANLQKAQAH